MRRHGTSYLKFVIYVLQQQGIRRKATERTMNFVGPWPNSHFWRLQLCLSFSMDLPAGMLTKLWSRHVEQVLWQLFETSGERSAKAKFGLGEVQLSGGTVQARYWTNTVTFLGN